MGSRRARKKERHHTQKRGPGTGPQSKVREDSRGDRERRMLWGTVLFREGLMCRSTGWVTTAGR